MNDEVINEVKRYSAIKGDRSQWETLWEEIASVVLPIEVGFLGDRTKGEKKHRRVFDSRPIVALERFAAIMDSMLTPRQTIWHGLRVLDDSLNSQLRVRDWFYKVNKILYNARYNPKANFASQNYERWLSMGAFGTGALFTDYISGQGLRYKSVGLKDIYVSQNHQGIIDTVYRRILFSARQAVNQWGSDMMPDRIMKELENHNSQKKFEFIHVVKPNTSYDDEKVDERGKKFSSMYISVDEKELVAKPSGYDVFPYSFSRYITAPGEVYGRGPAGTALADIKMLNEMNKVDIRAVHKLVDPPLLLSDDGILGNGGMRVNLKPGGLNYGGVNRDGRQLVQPLQTGARVDIAEQKMEQRRKSIDDAFLTTLFNILVETPRMTATEALIRSQEKGMLLTPTMGRQQSEALGPLIERELDLLMQHNILPELPPELIEAEGEYDITYESPMSRMQRAEELVGVQRTMELLTPLAQLNPEILDIFDQDELARLTAEVSGVPTPVLRDVDEVDAIRQSRRDAEQDKQMAEELKQMTEAVKPVSGAIKDIAQAQQISSGG